MDPVDPVDPVASAAGGPAGESLPLLGLVGLTVVICSSWLGLDSKGPSVTTFFPRYAVEVACHDGAPVSVPNPDGPREAPGVCGHRAGCMAGEQQSQEDPRPHGCVLVPPQCSRALWPESHLLGCR